MADLHVKYGGNAYYVWDGDVCNSRGLSLQQAHDRVDRLKRKARSKVRPCISCTTMFSSEGPHNRMCTPCRKNTSMDGDYATVSTGTRRGRVA